MKASEAKKIADQRVSKEILLNWAIRDISEKANLGEYFIKIPNWTGDLRDTLEELGYSTIYTHQGLVVSWNGAKEEVKHEPKSEEV